MDPYFSSTTINSLFSPTFTTGHGEARRGTASGYERPPIPGLGRDVILTDEHAIIFVDMLNQVIAEHLSKHPRSRAGRRLYYKVKLALHTGLRWGEVHGLG